MSEIEREEILAQRLEELQHAQDTRNLDQLVKAQKGGDSDAAKTKPRTCPCFVVFLLLTMV